MTDSSRTRPHSRKNGRYKWIALSNTTLGVFMVSLTGTSILLALPVIFRGIQIDPLAPGSFNYLLWLLMGYMVVVAVLVVTLGRLGDMFGRTRILDPGRTHVHAGHLASGYLAAAARL